jgi:hypothetical protein
MYLNIHDREWLLYIAGRFNSIGEYLMIPSYDHREFPKTLDPSKSYF